MADKEMIDKRTGEIYQDPPMPPGHEGHIVELGNPQTCGDCVTFIMFDMAEAGIFEIVGHDEDGEPIFKFSEEYRD